MKLVWREQMIPDLAQDLSLQSYVVNIWANLNQPSETVCVDVSFGRVST